MTVVKGFRQLIKAAPVASRSFKSGAFAPNSNHQHLFEPVASKSTVSPMRRTTPWIAALRAKQKYENDWKASHKNGEPVPESVSFAYTDVKTREVANRCRSDSFTCVLLPFRDDEWFLDAYINASGRLRIGQIFQDLDALAGVISYKHCYPAEPIIVTAAVDRIFILKRLDDLSQYNVTLSGCVTWTGKSSMEISIKAATHTHALDKDKEWTESDINDDEVFLTANFTFVARDPETHRSFPINKLVPTSVEEKIDFIRAEKFNAEKKEQAKKTGLMLSPPTEIESKIIHDMWVKQKTYEENPSLKPAHVVNMCDTMVRSTMIMQPQYRNRHSYMIFGGYLLRQTFELAYTCAAAFSHSVPRFVSLDSTTFKNPVPVGSVLYLTAIVAHTKNTTREIYIDGVETEVPGTLIQIRVDSTVRNLDHGTTTDTGQFTYSYFVQKDEKNADIELLPQSYNEMMEYLDGRRKAHATAAFYEERQLGKTTVVSE